MTAETAIRSLDELLKALDGIRARLAGECADIAACWSGLGRVGGQRDDHEAELLKRLRPHLRALESFARRCSEQLEETIAHPFGER
jgi:hypothetical protein